MKIVAIADLQTLRRHERATASNTTLGGYHMDKYCALGNFRILRGILEATDIERLYLLGQFAPYTNGRTCKLRDVRPEAVAPGQISSERVGSFLQGKVNLALEKNLDVVIVSPEEVAGPLILIDGNHRSVAHFLSHGGIDGIPAFVCVHRSICRWPYVPENLQTRI